MTDLPVRHLPRNFFLVESAYGSIPFRGKLLDLPDRSTICGKLYDPDTPDCRHLDIDHPHDFLWPSFHPPGTDAILTISAPIASTCSATSGMIRLDVHKGDGRFQFRFLRHPGKARARGRSSNRRDTPHASQCLYLLLFAPAFPFLWQATTSSQVPPSSVSNPSMEAVDDDEITLPLFSRA